MFFYPETMKLIEINMRLILIINKANANVCNGVDQILQNWWRNESQVVGESSRESGVRSRESE